MRCKTFGPANHWIDGNGVATDISYDEDYRVTAIDAHGASDILSLGYTYNDNSNITGILDKLGIDSQQFGYDKLNRLTSADGQYGAIDYAYDGVGDRTRRTVTKDSATTEEDYSYESSSHRLAAVTATDASGTTERTFSHDANGNTTSDTSPERVLQLVFNARNRLAEVTQDGNVVGQYEYNALGQRVAKTSTYRGRLHAHIDQGNKPGKNSGKGNASQSNVHATTDNAPVTEHLQFVYDEHGNLISESDDKGNVVREYIYLGDYRIAMTASTLDHPEVTPSNAVISTGSGAATGVEKSRTSNLSLYFIHTDHLGTPKVVTDQSQNIVWSMHQTPFGEATLDTEAVRMPMRFPGQYADIESGYRYNYFRDYDPTLGRYVESDPIGLVAGPAAFVYGQSSPLNYEDIPGLLAFNYHFIITYKSARAHGAGVAPAIILAGKVMAVDFGTQGGDASDTNLHGMKGVVNGQIQTDQEAARAINHILNDPIVDLSIRLHTTQDIAAPWHFLQVWNPDAPHDAAYFWHFAEHVFQDIFPGQAVLNDAQRRTDAMIEQYIHEGSDIKIQCMESSI